MTINKIYNVKAFNTLAESKWRSDCNNWKNKNGGSPSLSMYIYEKERGFVLKLDRGSKWFKTKKLAIAYLELINLKQK